MVPISEVKAVVTTVNWDSILGSGIVVPPHGDLALEALWVRIRVGSAGRGWQPDGQRRRRVEDYAQIVLTQYYRDRGWKVQDTRIGNPYDAVAVKGPELLYLEAKGTEGDGATVLVTPGEVRHARTHRGQCVLGVVDGIRMDPDGAVDETSGNLRIYEWDPDRGLLEATGYEWTPPVGR